MGEIQELFVLALSLVWFAGATPDKTEMHAWKTRLAWILLINCRRRSNKELLSGSQGYDPAGVVQSPKTPESRKYEKITKKNTNPRPQVAPRKHEKKLPFLYFFGNFFVFSGGDLP